jgi:predicted amidophosphoribosyltransferase
MSTLEEIVQLVFPGRCLGCHTLSSVICANCLEQWQVSKFKTKYSELTVHSAILYTPVAAKIILAAKENGTATADQLLIQAIMGQIHTTAVDLQRIRLVPIPSSKRSIRSRGRSFMADIVRQISNQMGIPMLDCLELTGKTTDQSGLNRQQRLENMKGSMSMKTMARGELILIDDVITTGATLKEAARALNSQGFYAQISAITACVAQPLR